jgi:pimeloyl-ACP methyl ester carboxylesterase
MDKQIISFDGTRICYDYFKGKSSLTLVFLHGVGANWTVWKKEINFFKKRGYSILTLDLRGHGESEAPDDFSKYRLHYFSRDINIVLKKEKINKFSFIGHSLGGAIAINYLMRYKKCYPTSVVFVDTSSTYPFKHNHLLNYGPFVTHFLRFISNHKLTKSEHFFHFNDIDLSEKGLTEKIHVISHLLHLTPLRTIVKTLDNVERYVFKNKNKINYTLKHLNVPTLIISGEYDQVVPTKYSLFIKKLKKNAEFKLVKKAHHKVIIEHPKLINKLIYDFINE